MFPPESFIWYKVLIKTFSFLYFSIICLFVGIHNTYKLNEKTKIENKQMPLADDEDLTIINNLELKTNKTNDCTITFSFVSKDGDQSYNFNKSFGGTYKVVVEE